MRLIRALSPSLAGALLLAVGAARAAVSITQDPLGPDGAVFAGSVSPTGGHMAVLAAQGSHYAVIVDGVAGPRIDSLIANAAGSPFRPATYWTNQPIPVIFSKDGAHWAYMAREGDEYVVMRDGRELARGRLGAANPAAALNLTFSADGQHLFWSEAGAGGSCVIVVDGKPGPAMRTLPPLVLSPDGAHYAYVDYNRDGTGAWAVVDGRQVNYFGDNLQYTARDVLLSTARAPGGAIFVINGKPSIKAQRVDPMWISPDGRQLALVVTPGGGAESFLSVDGRAVPGTQGLQIEKVYFSPDGRRYAALAVTRSGSRCMIIDGKRGDEYPGILAQVTENAAADTHWRFVTWTQNRSDFGDFQPPVPGFTADSSKFVYVASANGRQFLVVNGEESSAFGSLLAPVLSAVGSRIAAYGVTPDNVQHILLDGKDTACGPFLGGPRINQLTFSPHGLHTAFIRQDSTVYLDGVAQPGILRGNYVFSPDDRHLAYEANLGGRLCLVVDGRVISTNAGMVGHIFFSPDSNHVYWVSNGNLAVLGYPGTRDSLLLYVDGAPALHYTDNGTLADPLTDTTATLHPEFSADDAMTFIARTDGNLRRFHVSSGTNLAAVLAAAPAAGG